VVAVPSRPAIVPVPAVVVAVHVAVVIVMAVAAVPVRAPARVPPLARAPVVIRERPGLSLSVRRCTHLRPDPKRRPLRKSLLLNAEEFSRIA